MYDLAIIGAGPAGATLARLLPDRNVLLIDRRALVSANGPGEEKCCGGLLAPDAQARLDAMGLTLPDEILDAGQPMAVRAVDLAAGRSRLYPRRYVNLDRLAFERWLLSLLPASATVLDRHRCRGIAPSPNGKGWTLTLAGPGGRAAAEAAMVVGADGAGGMVRNALGAAPRRAAMYLAVQDSHPRGAGAESGFPVAHEYAAFFHPDITDFYGWVIPKRDRLLFGVALPLGQKRRLAARNLVARAKEALEVKGYRFPGAPARQTSLLFRPGPGDVFLGRDGIWCVGEAAGFISPSSAEGYSYAFASAEALAGALRRHTDHAAVLRAYRRNTRPLVWNLAWKQGKSAVMFSPALRALIMKSGVLARE